MVSIWPWKTTDDTASFEKTLSSLSSKITKANVSTDSLRTRSRRYKVLWTLYTTLAYLLSALILILVTGWRNWGSVEYTVIAGSPLIIFLVRTALSSYYTYRLSSSQAHVAQLQKQRDEAIEKFKTATKYNTTQQLLEKYGAAPPKPAESPSKLKTSPADNRPHKEQTRTGIAPPPTANIRRPGDGPSSLSSPGTPQPQVPPSGQQPPTPQSSASAQTAYAAFNQNTPIAQQAPSPTAEFAPNAYIHPQQYASPGSGGGRDAYRPQWYDRVMDLLLGEDETKASNRLALICDHCRLVHGQAPPGARTLEDMGRWRCGGCKGWNGVDKTSEVTKIVREVTDAAAAAGAGDEDKRVSDVEDGRERNDDGDGDGDVDEVLEADGVDDKLDEEGDGEVVERESDDVEDEVMDPPATSAGAGADEPPARSTRSQRTATKMKG